MGETLKDRVILFQKYASDKHVASGHKKMGQSKFEEFVGLANGAIANIGEGVSTISLLKIKEKYPELSLEWLLTGTGPMLTNAQPDLAKETPEQLLNTLASLLNLKQIQKRLAVIEKKLNISSDEHLRKISASSASADDDTFEK